MSDEKDDIESSQDAAASVVEAADEDEQAGGPADGEIDASDGEAPQAEEPTPEEMIAELKDQLLRALAETENVRRRAERDVTDARRFATADFARDLLAVADNMQRAIDIAKANAEAGSEAVVEGVDLTLRQLEQMLEKHEIRVVEALGLKLDPNLHQAMVQIEDATAEPGTIIQIMQTGYTIHDRLLRPALVGVAKAPASADTGQQVDTEA